MQISCQPFIRKNSYYDSWKTTTDTGIHAKAGAKGQNPGLLDLFSDFSWVTPHGIDMLQL